MFLFFYVNVQTMLCRSLIQPKRLDGQNIEKCLAPHIWGAICTTYHAMFSRWCHMSLSDKYLNQPFPFKPRTRGLPNQPDRIINVILLSVLSNHSSLPRVQFCLQATRFLQKFATRMMILEWYYCFLF